jgi:hypothetical protein
MVVGGVFGLLVVGFLGGSLAHPSLTNAIVSGGETGGVSCDVKRVGTNDVGGENSRFILNADGTVTARFEVTGTDCHQAVTLDTWQAPNGTDGKPYAAQKLFSRTTGVYQTGFHTISTKMPSCFYQVDLLVGKATVTTVPYTSATPLRGNLHGGTQSCDTPVATPTPTPQVETASSTLPNTGPGAIILVFVLALAGGYIFHIRHHHRLQRHAHATARGSRSAQHSKRK